MFPAAARPPGRAERRGVHMAKQVNTHGLKMIGLEEAAKEIRCWSKRQDTVSIEVHYDTVTGDILYSTVIGDNWVEYRDPDIIRIGRFADNHIGAQWLADQIKRVVSEKEYWEKIYS